MKTIALDIGGTSIKAGEVVDGVLCSPVEYDTNAKQGGEYVVRHSMDIISQYSEFDAIGISTAGQVDFQQGRICFANENIPGYTSMPIKQIMEERFKVHVTVENDVNSAAIGEAQYGAGKGLNDFLCLTFGTGIGGAIVINRQIYRGSTSSAAEFGHLITHAQGRACNCGLHGCYERYASTGALVREAMRLDPVFSNGCKIFEHINEPQVQAVVDDWIQEIIFGLTSLIHIFNPSCVIMGGGIMNEIYIINKLQGSIYSNIMPSYANVVIRQAQLGNHAGLLGVSCLASRCLAKTLLL
jgi:predicted NBD/HSP70 family sugar kinase